MGTEKYKICKTELRKFDSSKDILKKNINLAVKKIPSYYINVWQQSCKMHNLDFN